MDINELETYRLSDAIKYHDRLNPRLWGSDEHLLPEVRERLLEIARDFQEFLGINVDVEDITISGSNAAYTYTDHSDIDLHLVVDLPRADSDEVYRELFDAKKYQYNDRNDFRIGGADVELYVQDPSKPHHSQGIYSIKRGEWIDVPKRRKPEVDDVSVRSKYEDLGARIESAVESGDLSEMDRVAAKIKEIRQAGLDQHGEFGAENLAFKILRNNGTLERLSNARKAARDARMSLAERKRKRSRKRKRYAYGGYWYPGYHYYAQSAAPADVAADGGGDGGGESVRESRSESMQDVIERFAQSCSKLLALKNVPRIRLRRDPAWTERNGTFGRYTAEPHNTIELATAGRHIIDILRTLAHEMTHAHQNETTGLPADAGETGSEFEDEANAMAGRIMRHWAESEPEMFRDVNLEEDWRKTAGAVAAAACVAGTPGCATTKDAVKTVQTIGRAAQNIPTRAGAEEELRQAVKDTLRRQRGEVVPEAIAPVNPVSRPIVSPINKSRRVEPVTPTQRTRTQYPGDRTRPDEEPRLVDIRIKESSGYIPTEKERDDPRYSMALTVDIHPGQTGKEANKLGLKTDSQGRPALLMKKLENLLESVKAGEDHAVATIKKKAFNWVDYHELPMATVMDLAESCLLTNNNLLESNSPEASGYFQDLFAMGEIPKSGGQYLVTMLVLANDRAMIAQEPVQARVLEKHSDHEYTVELPDGRVTKFPYQVLRDRAVFNTWFFDSADGYDRFRSAVALRFSVDLPNMDLNEVSNFIAGRPLGDPPRLMGEPIEREDDIRDVLERYLKIQAPNATEATKMAIEMLAKRPQSRLSDVVLGDLELIVDRFHVPVGSFYRAVLDHALHGYYQPNKKRLEESEDLFEVKMSPGELQKWAQSEEAQGIRAGFEAELIFRDTGREEEFESEPDYDQDERARDIESVIDFFQGGENGIGRNTANRLRDEMYEAFQQWQSDGFYDRVWTQRLYTEWVDDNIWPDEQDEWRERAQAELGLEDKQELTPEQNDQIEQTAEQMFREESDEQWESQGPWYTQAEEDLFDQHREENEEAEWLDDVLPYMSDVANEHNLDWPYWTEGGGREGGSRDIEDIADSLSRNLGVRAVASSDYHSTRRRPDLWIVEPDGSLSADEYEDTGLEIVSPPMPLPEALKKLREVIEWANGNGDAYTNDSTGLHMGVSIPHKGGEVDYVKLVLFMGDKFVLDDFGRAANNYTRSALEKLQSVQRSRRAQMSEAQAKSMTGAEKTAAAMDLMRKNLIELAQRYVQEDVGQSKYTSAHIKDGYIEFRSPGGDYLSMDSRDEDALANTMLRFARAMYIAGRPDLERKEYSKKLYKLLTGYRGAETKKSGRDTKYRTEIQTEDSRDALELFARYTTGQISAEELKKEWAREVLAKEQPDSESEKPGYEIYDKNTGKVLEVVPGSWSDARVSAAIADAIEKYSGQGFDIDLRRTEISEPEKKPSRRAEIARKLAGRPTLWRVSAFDREVFVMSPTAEQAKALAIEQDYQLGRNRSYVEARPATEEEKARYRVQQADNEKDSEQIQRRVAPDVRFPYRVSWREIQGGREIEDSLNLDAASADAAVDGVRRSLEASGRRVVPGSLQARPRQEAGYEPGRSREDQPSGERREYHIYSRDTNNPVIGFMASTDEEALARLERFRLEHPDADVGVRTGGESMQTPAQQAQGEWTGHWIVRDAQGRELTRFHGIGNSQADANRHALRWLVDNGYGSGTEVDVVPEMQ
jgi:hypothetical protein